jgi:hypothetical protein
MNKTSFTRFALATLLAAAALPLSTLRTTQAQPPSASQPFTTRIYVQNPNPNPASGVINFFDELGSGMPHSVNVSFNLNSNGSTEILVGTLSGLGSGWKGSAVISADQPVVAASIQVPPSGYGHMMSNAFTSAEGTSNLFLTTFLRNVGDEVSLFGVQNIESEAINIRARFIDTAGNPVITPTLVLQANTAKFFDAANAAATIGPGFPAIFNGSVVVTATKVSDGSPARIVGISETRRNDTGSSPNRFRAYAFEAIPLSAGAQTIYLPTALCKFGAGSQTTFVAVQNLSFTSSTVVTVTYAAGTNQPGQATNTLPPLAKWSFNPCQTNGNLPYSGAATITSSSQPIAAVGKNNQTSGPPTQPRYSTAFLAQASGASRLAVPYIRWSPSSPGTDFRSLIAIQNLGAIIPAGQLIVRYYAPDGTLVNTCTSAAALATGQKANSNVAAAFAGGVNFNCTTVQPNDGASYSFTGSAVIEGPAGANLIAIIRNTTPAASTQIHTEDFNAILLLP